MNGTATKQHPEMTDYAELRRPQYHFSTLDSRVNAPNGLVYYKGVYHLYYQCLPHTVREENPRTADYLRRYREAHPFEVLPGQHWGHATSPDLIHWQEQELALFPDDVGYMWSGTAVVDTDNSSGFFTDTEEGQGIVIAYSTNTQHIGIAYSTDGGKSFRKVSTSEPVIRNPGICSFRDPHIFRHAESGLWKMVVAGKGGKMWIYEAADLVHWTLCSVDGHINTECPNLFPMYVEDSGEKKWILSCVGRGYYVGRFDGKRFFPETDYIAMNEGPDAYAGITFSNMPDGRTVMISWLNAYDVMADGKWNGCFTVPVELRLVAIGDSYRLLQTPVRELALIRGENLLTVEQADYRGSEDPLAGICSNCFDLSAEIDLSRSGRFSLAVCSGEGEQTVLSYDRESGCISLDRHMANCGIPALVSCASAFSFFVSPDTVRDGILKLRLLVDVSNLELFVNDGYYYFVMRMQPFSTSRAMSLSYDKSLCLKKLRVDACRSIWFEQKASRDAVHISDDTPRTVGVGCVDRNVMVGTLRNSPVFCSSSDTAVAEAAIEGNLLRITGISEGEAEIRLSSDECFRILKVTVCKEGKADAEAVATAPGAVLSISGLNRIARAVREYSGRISVQKFGSGRACFITEEEILDLSLDIRVTLRGKGVAGILFRARNAANACCVDVDAQQGAVRLWQSVAGERIELGSVQHAIERNVPYAVRVVALGTSIRVLFNDMPILEAQVDTAEAGRLALNAAICDVAFDDLHYQSISG